MKKIYGYNLPHSLLILYGNNMNACRPYIDNAVNSVEDVCQYCSVHNLRILHKIPYSPNGFVEYIRVYRLTKKYSVRGSWKEISQYF